MRKQLEEYEREYQELNTIIELQARLEKLKQMMAWGHVVEAETVIFLNYQ